MLTKPPCVWELEALPLLAHVSPEVACLCLSKSQAGLWEHECQKALRDGCFLGIKGSDNNSNHPGNKGGVSALRRRRALLVWEMYPEQTEL